MISRTSLHIKAVASVLVAAIKLSVITIDIQDLVSVRKTVEGAEPIDIDPVCQWTLTSKRLFSTAGPPKDPLKEPDLPKKTPNLTIVMGVVCI